MHNEGAKYVVDGLSLVTILATFMSILPPIAAFLGIVWYILQIYGWFDKRSNKSKNRHRRDSDNN